MHFFITVRMSEIYVLSFLEDIRFFSDYSTAIMCLKDYFELDDNLLNYELTRYELDEGLHEYVEVETYDLSDMMFEDDESIITSSDDDT